MTTIKYLRTRLANWLSPEPVTDKSAYDNIKAEHEAQGYAIAKLRDRTASLETANGDLANRAAAAGLKLTVMRDALKRALPYVQDAHDEAFKQGQTLGPKNKQRAAVLATVAAIWSDIVAVKNASTGAEGSK